MLKTEGQKHKITTSVVRGGGSTGFLPVEGATQAPVIAEMLQMANNVRR
ncbi:MAG: hypothetical protein KBE27_05200 [Syntrophorhabdaceae bacterium]|nr:hypothetical protein [Syntrophorhabdales bacterium]MBP9561195.1 hypothetical protein [Syntrophorhabdaceae bacterium]